MNSFDDLTKLDTVLPGVSGAYAALRSHDGYGLYTSRGKFFNGTVFGRDASMSAKFVADFDHQAALDIITQLIALQGVEDNPKTQEEPGRIHHEWRDFRAWRGSAFDHVPFWLLHDKWDIRNRQLLTYYSLDTTASFVRMVHKYATRIDASILDRTMKDKNGEPVTVAVALKRAAAWLVANIDDGLLTDTRRSRFSLPVQTFQDSLYARRDGRLIDLGGPVAYLEVQAFAADALRDMAQLFPEHKWRFAWHDAARQLHDAMLEKFRQDDGTYASAIDRDGQVDVPNVSMGWILNTFLWRDMTDSERERYMTPVIERLFSDEFLTPVGLRTRARSAPDPLPGAVDYHGSQTVWPMFSFMVVEGLRRHRMYDLAEQLERRIINGLNAAGEFKEFHVVRRSGELVLPGRGPRLDVQMKPERLIGFSIVPGIVLARRALTPPQRKAQRPWQSALEARVLATIPLVERAAPDNALAAIGTVQSARFVRWRAGVRTSLYFWRHRDRVVPQHKAVS